MSETAQERTERPTPKRIEDARKRGQVPRSQELSAAAVVLMTAGVLYLFGTHVAESLYDIMRSSLQLSREQALDEGQIHSMLSGAMRNALLACAPLLGLTLAAAFLAPMAIGGWNVSSQALTPDFKRLSPLNGLKRMFSMRGVVELGKAFAKFGVVALFAIIFLWSQAGELLSLGAEPSHGAIGHALALTGQALLIVSLPLALIAAIDVPWQLWQHTRRLRMTREEIRQELKESEGSPEVRSRIRAAQQEIAKRRMMQEVPKADVVITDPTHYSVALRYEERKMRAPVVVAKGVDEVAMRIREVATEHGVPIFEAPPLARALHRNVDIGSEIPASLYVAVAQVLTYVYQLRAARTHGGMAPQPPEIDPSVEQTRH